MEFKNPHLLWLLFALLFLFFHVSRKEKKMTIGLPFFGFFSGGGPTRNTFRVKLYTVSRYLPVLAAGLLIIALARPQRGYIEDTFTTEGIDIVLALDISSSMKAEDFKPNRLGAAKNVAKEFIQGRKNDKIGLVVFSRKAITQSPLTLDYGILTNFLDSIEIGMIQDGTAIGNAVAEAAMRLQSGREKSKVCILLTDGINNSGEIDPVTAAQAAQALGIKIYAIGVGSAGNAPYPVDDPAFGKRYVFVPVQIDEQVLLEIANITKGRYFRATDTKKLEEIYREIDSLEKSKIEIRQYKRVRERFAILLAAAMALFLVHVILTRMYLKVYP
jgi:Ca-activated chloride channel family protein